MTMFSRSAIYRLRIRAAAALTVLVTLFSFDVTLAQETSLQQFEVELVIFRNTNPMGTQEDWALAETRAKTSVLASRDQDEPNVNAPAAVAPSVGLDSSIQPLESTRFKLTNVEATLKRSRNYAPVAHIAWTQPGFALDGPRPLGIDNFVSSTTNLSGTVTLTRGRYLRMVLDLTWQAPDGKRYVLREQRRMKSGEKHYFDHPYFGVVALVTPKSAN